MKVNYRQLSIMVFMSFIALKILALPSLLYATSGNMGWFVTLILMILDGVYAIIIVSLMQKNQNKNIYDFMLETLGKPLTKVFMFLLMIKYAIVIVNITKSLEIFVIENFYSEYSWTLFILPLIAVVGFMVYKGIQNVGRVYEMFFWAIVIGCIYIALKSIQGVDLLSFLPMFKDGFQPILNGAFRHMSWFGSSTFLIVLFGKVDFKDAKKFKLVKYIISAILLVQLIYFVFYGIFGITGPTHSFGLSDISQYFKGASFVDELSWLIIALWVVTQSVQIAMFGFCFASSFNYVFNVKTKIIPIIVLDLIMISWGFVSRENIHLEEIFFHPVTSCITITVQYIIPIFLWLGYLMKTKKEKRTKQEEIGYENAKTNI